MDKGPTWKLLEENTGGQYHDVAFGNDFLDTVPQKSDFVKRKSTQFALLQDLELLYIIKKSDIIEW